MSQQTPGHDAVTEYIRHQLWESNELFEYAVVPVHQTVFTEKVKTAGLQDLLNQWAYSGWHVRSVTQTNIEGRIGPSGKTGLIIIFERRLIDAGAMDEPPPAPITET